MANLEIVLLLTVELSRIISKYMHQQIDIMFGKTKVGNILQIRNNLKAKTPWIKGRNKLLYLIFSFSLFLFCYFIPAVCKKWVNWIKTKTAASKKRQNNYLSGEINQMWIIWLTLGRDLALFTQPIYSIHIPRTIFRKNWWIKTQKHS